MNQNEREQKQTSLIHQDLREWFRRKKNQFEENRRNENILFLSSKEKRSSIFVFLSTGSESFHGILSFRLPFSDNNHLQIYLFHWFFSTFVLLKTEIEKTPNWKKIEKSSLYQTKPLG